MREEGEEEGEEEVLEEMELVLRLRRLERAC